MALRPPVELAMGNPWKSVCAVALGMGALVLAVSALAKIALHVPGPNLPNQRLTPGAHFLVGRAKICVSGYSARVRDVPESETDADYARYHIRRVAYAYEVDA